VGAQGANLPADRKLQMLANAYQDIQQYRDAVPDDPWGTIDSCWTTVWLDYVRTGNSFNPQTIAVLTTLMENLRDPQQRAAALFVRAAATNYRPETQPDLDEAVRLVPCGFTGAAAYNTRGMFWQQRGRSPEASADFHRAGELLDAERLAVKAEEALERTFVSEDELRRVAEGLAEACKLTGYTRWQHAYLMAFLQHRLGDDATATAWATTALSLAPDDRKTRIRTDLAAYGDAAGRKRQTTCFSGMPQAVPAHTTFLPTGNDVPILEPIDPREPSIATVRDVLR
jgi:tetratricopeptide (TPR) repeat protein